MHTHCLRNFCWVPILAYVLHGCQSILPQKSLQSDTVLAETLNFDQLQLRTIMSYQDSQNNYGIAYVRFRIQKDTIIWFSVTVALGVEVMRGIITPTGITMLNRIQEEYYDYDYACLCTHLNYTCSYDLIQALLLGTLPFTHTPQEIVQKDAGQVIIQQQRPPWVVTQIINCAASKQEKYIVLVDTVTQGRCAASYKKLKKLKGGTLPEKLKIYLYPNAYQEQPEVTIAMDKVKASWPKNPLEFPFSIPAHYEKK